MATVSGGDNGAQILREADGANPTTHEEHPRVSCPTLQKFAIFVLQDKISPPPLRCHKSWNTVVREIYLYIPPPPPAPSSELLFQYRLQVLLFAPPPFEMPGVVAEAFPAPCIRVAVGK